MLTLDCRFKISDFRFAIAHPQSKICNLKSFVPQRLKPQFSFDSGGTTEVVPFPVVPCFNSVALAEQPRFARRADEGVRPYT
jgi:hypothetical protein